MGRPEIATVAGGRTVRELVKTIRADVPGDRSRTSLLMQSMKVSVDQRPYSMMTETEAPIRCMERTALQWALKVS